MEVQLPDCKAPHHDNPGPSIDSDSENEVQELGQLAGPCSISEKRKAQNSIFRDYVARKTENITQEELKQIAKETHDEELSTRNLISKSGTADAIPNPREYQIELFEKAKQENIIAVLDTGSGKTLVAVLLLRHVLDKELEERANNKPPRIAFFLVDSVTLVFQQHAVLESNLDHKIERFCGAMGCDLWVKEAWDKHFAENMVIVCTAEILHQCLMHSFIRIDQINLLVFDEAHHAKKNHAYARIIKDHYTGAHPPERPRIFGMTASPVDAKVDVWRAAMELEQLLHCRIATTANLSLLQQVVCRPSEKVVLYPQLPDPFETPLYQALHRKFGKRDIFDRLFREAKEASSELGRWCSDMFWSFSLTEEESRKMELREERLFSRKRRFVDTFDADFALPQDAKELLENHNFGSPQISHPDLSEKILMLHQQLQLYLGSLSDARCIVFVEKRSTAHLLHLVFSRIGGPNLRTGVIVGANGPGNMSQSFRRQILTLAKLRKGELNCLFATSVAEEGLDIPDCNLVVRFDLYRSMIQYVQSRGRARHKNSSYLHMLENGNLKHYDILREVRASESIMRAFCTSLPADRLLRGSGFDLGPLDEGKFKAYKDPKTGATVTFGSSLSLLNHFVDLLPESSSSGEKANYIISAEGSKFICEVVLPEGSPIRSVVGQPQKRKILAKQSAALEACALLRRKNFLDANFLPVYTKQLPAMRNALLALSGKKKNIYDMRIKPSLWKEGRGSLPSTLYVTILDVTEALERSHQPIALLTRCRIPQLTRFPLFLNNGKTVMVKSLALSQSLQVSETELSRLSSFTLRVFKDIFAKTYENSMENYSYWLAPVPVGVEWKETIDPISALDRIVLEEVFDHEEYIWTPTVNPDFLRDKFIVDRWDGARRFFSLGVAPSLKPDDPVPSGTAKGKWGANILDYSVSLWGKARKTRVWDPTQPVIEAEKVLLRRDLLSEAEAKEKVQTTKCYLCPEPLKISALSTRVATMCIVFPAIIHRFESYLIALEAANMLGLDIGPRLALEAVTKDSDNIDEQDHETINFRRGMGNNYERLEFMGDCFLKMATSISVFSQNPDDHEFDFHVKRMLLLCNKNLFNTALQLKLYEYIRTLAFSRRTWYPEGLKLLEGRGANKGGSQALKHALGDKTIADVCEAFIGAAFIQHNEPGVFKPDNWRNAVRAVTKFVNSKDHTMMEWEDYLKAYSKPQYQTAQATASQLDLAAKVELKHDYHFRWPRLLRSAFMHQSQPSFWEKIPSYQRLEFLGDSLLDLACVTYLFYKYPDKDPQWLTEHKMAMVSNMFLGALCVKLGFYRHLRHTTQSLDGRIRQFVMEIEEAERESDGKRDYWTTVREAPKCLPDIIEAYVGAMFVDSEFDFGEVQRFFDKHIKWFFEDMTIYDTFANNHPVTRLNHLLSEQLGCEDYRVMAEELPCIIPGGPTRYIAGMMIHEKVIAEGIASSGKNAKIKACANALEMVEGLPQFEFRSTFKCTCKRRGVEPGESNGSPVNPAVGTAV